MAYFYRLILRRIVYVLVALLFGFITAYFNSAQAAIFINSKLNGHMEKSFSTQAAFCQHAREVYTEFYTGQGYTNIVVTCSPTALQLGDYSVFVQAKQGTNDFSTTHAQKGLGVNTPCVSPQGYDPTTSTCTAPSTCSVNKDKKVQFSLSTDSAATSCFQGCNHKHQDSICLQESPTVQRCYITAFNLGTSCTTPVSEVATTPAFDCVKQGLSSGTVNGLVVCVPKTSTTATPLIEKTTDLKTVTSPTGTTTTATTTTTNNNTVTTSVTTTAPNGTQTTESKEQDKGSYCEENPNLKLCKEENKGAFAGSCNSFTCDGDAIQCAIAKKIHQNKCDELKVEQDSKTALLANITNATGKKLLDGEYSSDVNDFINQTGGSTRTVNIANSLSETGTAGFASNEIQDQTHTVMGQSFTVPFSNANDYFYIFGNVLLALAYLGAYKIVTSDI